MEFWNQFFNYFLLSITILINYRIDQYSKVRISQFGRTYINLYSIYFKTFTIPFLSLYFDKYECYLGTGMPHSSIIYSQETFVQNFIWCCRYPAGIASLAFSPDGAVLAIASSYMYENDEPIEPVEDVIYIRNVSDQETKPKS